MFRFSYQPIRLSTFQLFVVLAYATNTVEDIEEPHFDIYPEYSVCIDITPSIPPDSVLEEWSEVCLVGISAPPCIVPVDEATIHANLPAS